MTEVSTSGIALAKPDQPKQRSPLYFAWRRFAANKAALGAGWAFDLPRDGLENQLVARRLLLDNEWGKPGFAGIWLNVRTA